MKLISKPLAVLMVAVMLAGFVLIPQPRQAVAATYSDYTLVDTIYNYGGCTGMQGLAVDDTYLYNIKIASSTQDNAFISRTHKDTGSTTYMTNAATGTIYFSEMYHANDLEYADIAGVKTLFVATSLDGSTSLLRYAINGTTLTEIGRYDTVYNGSSTAISSAQVMRVTDTDIDLMIKKGKYLYYATLGVNATSGSIEMTHAFTLDVANINIGGQIIDMSDWLHQGFEYIDNKIFVPITCESDMSISSVCVFHTQGMYGTIKNDPDLSFYIDSETYDEKFEIESCKICPSDGRLYFNTNQGSSTGGHDQDAVHYFTDYVYDPSNGATDPDVYRWETQNDVLQSVTDGGAGFNGLAMSQGSISGGVYTNARYSLSEGVVLKHSEPWILEWKSSGNWTDGALLLSGHNKSKYEGNRYLFRRKNSTLIALGEYSDGNFYNYGLDLASYGVDGTAEHIYRMTNKIAADGSNMVYLSVDGKELGALDNYYIAGTAQGTKSDWLNGKDFVFSYIGTDQHPIDTCSLDYLQVWGRGVRNQVDDPDTFYWGSGLSAVSGTGLTENTATATMGSVSGSAVNAAQFRLDQNVVLLHNRPWSVEWQSDGSWTGGALLLAGADGSDTVGAPYLFRNANSGIVALGCYDGTNFNNYGLLLSDFGIDGTAKHTYRLTNRINPDGSNMVYLYVDGAELGALNKHYIGGSNYQGTSDWVSGKDFSFGHFGTIQHEITANIHYMRIWENGIPADHISENFRWETLNDTLTSVGSSFNQADQLAGSCTDGVYSGSYFRVDKPVVLRHDRPWSIQWESEGSWTDAANGSLLLCSSTNGNKIHAPYLYRRNGSHIIAFGERLDGYHQNYGIKLSDHGIDGTAKHTYRIENRIAADGSNMAYLLVDGVELGAMNNHFKGGTAQNTTVDWLNGKDLVFSYIGNPDFPLGNTTLSYLQIDEGCTHSFGSWSGTDATCTDGGAQTRSCTLCGYTETKTTAAIGHSYTAQVTPPTCTASGFTTYTCTACGHSYTADEVPTIGHSYDEGVITVQPTCTVTGVRLYTCTVCGDTYQKSIYATGHSYTSKVTAPTCTDEGYTTYTCTACGYSYVDDIQKATGHSYSGGYCLDCGAKDPTFVALPTVTLKYPTLAFEDEILYNVYYYVNDLSRVTEMGLLTFADRNYEGTVADALEIIPGFVTNSDGSFTAHSNGVPAKMLGDTLFFKVYAKLTDGTYVYSDVAGYHAVVYANTVLGGNSSAKAKSLVVAMLNYGAAAQVSFEYKTESLMNANLTAAQQALVEDYNDSMVAAVPSATSKAGSFVNNGGYSDVHPTVSFEGAFSINYYFTPKYNPAGGQVSFYYWTLSDFNQATVLTPENAGGSLVMTSATDVYTAAVEGIAAKAIDEPVYIAARYTNGGTTYYTPVIGYSLGTYCKNLATNGNTFGAATAVYGYYAKAYFAD